MPLTLDAWQARPLTAAAALLLFVIHLLIAARAITRANRTPASRVAWVAVIMSLPMVGIAAYLLLGETSIGPRRVQRLREAEARMPSLATQAMPADELRSRVAPHVAELLEFARSINGFAPTPGNRITLLGDPAARPSEPMRDSDAAVDALIADIARARHSVHIAFYIWLDDGNGGKVADAVSEAARRGVACRVMVDALGSRAFTRSPRWQQLKGAGVQLVATLDDIPRLGHLAVGRPDLRNHRKIVVIDNRIGFCGSQNCADPQFRVAARFAPWIDIWLRCEGPVVRQEQALFLAGWIAETGDADGELAALPGLPAEAQRSEAGPADPPDRTGVIAQMFGTGPTTHGNAMSDMFVATLYAARHELLITTPYFVPDEALLRALCAAPRRGVQTTIVFPARNNSWLVGAACRSTYPDLLAAGVRIHEYPLGLLHTKSVTVDGELALVGSANMDRRSLQLNFENNLLIADAATTATIVQRQQGYLSVSWPVSATSVHAWPLARRLVQNAVGMMSPVL